MKLGETKFMEFEQLGEHALLVSYSVSQGCFHVGPLREELKRNFVIVATGRMARHQGQPDYMAMSLCGTRAAAFDVIEELKKFMSKHYGFKDTPDGFVRVDNDLRPHAKDGEA